MPNLKSWPGLRGAYFLYLFLWKKRSKTRREKGIVDASVATVGSTVAVLAAGWWDLNYSPANSTKILRQVEGIVTGNKILPLGYFCAEKVRESSLEKVSWAHDCSPTCYRNEL